MANLEQFFIVKRGRPRKISKEYLKSLQESIQNSADSSTLKYFEKQKNYLKEIYCQKFKMMLSIIPKFANFPYKVRTLPLLNLLEESAKKHIMNELEISALSLLLSSVQWESTKYLAEEILEACCLITKRYFESDIELVNYLQIKLESQYSNLGNIITYMEKDFCLDIKDINKRLKTLLKHSQKFNANYTYYVDEIIRMSPPYNIDLKKTKVDEKDSKVDDIFSEELDSEGMNFLYCNNTSPQSEKSLIFIITTQEPKEIKDIQDEPILKPNKSEPKILSTKKALGKAKKLVKPQKYSKRPKTHEKKIAKPKIIKNSYRSKKLDLQNNLENGNSKIPMKSSINDEINSQVIHEILRETILNDLVPLDNYEKYLIDPDFCSFEFSGMCTDDEEESISNLLALI